MMCLMLELIYVTYYFNKHYYDLV